MLAQNRTVLGILLPPVPTGTPAPLHPPDTWEHFGAIGSGVQTGTPLQCSHVSCGIDLDAITISFSRSQLGAKEGRDPVRKRVGCLEELGMTSKLREGKMRPLETGTVLYPAQ